MPLAWQAREALRILAVMVPIGALGFCLREHLSGLWFHSVWSAAFVILAILAQRSRRSRRDRGPGSHENE
jgi:uncharacterized membrane protein YfcA